PAHADADFASVMRSLAQDWPTQIRPLALGLLGILFSAEVWLTYTQMQLRAEGIHRFAGEMLRKLLVISLVAALFTFPALFIHPMLEAFRNVGAALNGGQQYSPAEIGALGATLGEILLVAWTEMMAEVLAGLSSTRSIGGFMAVLSWIFNQGLVSLTVVGFAVTGLQLAYWIAALQLLLIEIETIVLVAAGVFFVGFVSFRVTAGLVDAYLKHLITVGLKLFFVQFMVGVGMRLTEDSWSRTLAGAVIEPDGSAGLAEFPMIDIIAVGGVVINALIFAYLVWKIPTLYGDKLGAGIHTGIRSGMGGGG
ncbi:MAG: type IV secretion system protein, partial [Gemmatimonadota bacterium]|nr:type IV secretion system protein [Gemmatimonadota bacterium]